LFESFKLMHAKIDLNLKAQTVCCFG